MGRALHLAAGTRRLLPNAVACAVGALLATTATNGCFKPGIEDGGFACAKEGKACPDGFECAFNGRCYRNASTVSDAGEPMSAGDAGERMCSAAPVAPTCQDDPRVGELCNPACQKGCECGRCNVLQTTGHAACVPSGTVTLGGVCKPGTDDNCAAGLICIKETCGNNLGRCYKHCTADNQCAGTICTVAIPDTRGQDTGFKTCDVPPQACDPVINAGCPSPALNCYLTSANLTLCDCPGPTEGGKLGAPCAYYRNCAPGFVCIGEAGGAFSCRVACNVATPACTTGTTCIPTGTDAKFGYCG